MGEQNLGDSMAGWMEWAGGRGKNYRYWIWTGNYCEHLTVYEIKFTSSIYDIFRYVCNLIENNTYNPLEIFRGDNTMWHKTNLKNQQ